MSLEQFWFCPRCGTKNNGSFCSKCGEARPNTDKIDDTSTSLNQTTQSHSNNSLKYIMITIIVILVGILAGILIYLHKGNTSDNNIQTTSSQSTQADETSATSKSVDNTKPANDVKSSDTNLNEANTILQNKNAQYYKLSAVSKMDDDGFFGLAAGKGVIFVIYDKKDDIVATVSFDKKLLDPRANSNSTDKPLQFTMNVLNDNPNSKDRQAGYWSDSEHSIPIQVYTKVQNNKLIPLGIYTYQGQKVSKFDDYLYEQQNVNLVNTLLNHADSLNDDIIARNISLP